MVSTIPIVDLGGSVAATDKDDQIIQQLDHALSTVGFVYLTNHGIHQSLIDDVFKESKSFFQLPEDVKNKSRRDSTISNDGYVGIDQEMLANDNQHELKAAFNFLGENGHFLEDDFPEFRPIVSRLAFQLCDLTKRLLRYLALALGLEENYFVDRHQFLYQDSKKNATTFRTLYYPSLTEADVKPGVVRCGAHSDYGTITLLLQDDVGGLEVLSGKEWISATPIPGAILLNLGDLMHFWTAGRYTATVHRVLVPAEEIRRQTTRQSIAFFVHPDNDVVVSQLDGAEDSPSVVALDYLMQRLSATYKY